MKRSIPVIVAFVLVVCGTVWGQASQEDSALAAMKASLEQYSSTLLAGDVEAWGRLHTQNVIKMWPDAPATRTREEMVATFSQTLKQLQFVSFKINVVKSEVHGDLGVSWGLYSWDAQPRAGGDLVSYDGKFLTLYQKQPDGRWLISYDCFNSNVAPVSQMD